MNTAPQKPQSHVLCGALACLCLLIQQFLLPAHMLLHEHTFDGFVEVHAHSHQEGCSDRGDASEVSAESPESDASESQPHPVEDHADETPEPGLEPYPQVQLATLRSGLAFTLRDPVAFDRLFVKERAPRAPPFVRASAQLRAPPQIT